ncbi:Tannase/feruloyl esterase [Ilyonectria destructans]|nr:Tannase/feruloyl esterase [Ilyonectria destructans]
MLALTRALSLSTLCTKDYLKSALPVDGFFPGITANTSSIHTDLVQNVTYGSQWYPTTTMSYGNITFAYSHVAPSQFKGRYLSTGGGGFAINKNTSYIPAGIINGAVSGATDGGFGSFTTQLNEVALLANNTLNWQTIYMFGYQAHHELAVLGKEFTRKVYKVSNKTKIFSYYFGCSEGGCEGWSQIQRFGDQFDGLTLGAPAFRFGQQQVNHLTGGVLEQGLGYFPPPCELGKIESLIVEACDPLDGKQDGIVARSDLCKLHFDLKSTIGKPYSCEATNGTVQNPSQKGVVTAEGVAVVQAFLDGLHDSNGRRVYFSFQPGAQFTDLIPRWNAETGNWALQDADNLSNLDNVTVDTLKDWMDWGMNKYLDSLQTTNPDISGFRKAGGKILHVHGEIDDSIPATSSVRYYESVRSILFPDSSYKASVAALDKFYRLYLVPGAGHCGGGAWPQTTVRTVIEWVEKGIVPDTLEGTNDVDHICRWPLRPLWKHNGTSFQCVYDQVSINSWKYNLDSWKVPVY